MAGQKRTDSSTLPGSGVYVFLSITLFRHLNTFVDYPNYPITPRPKYLPSERHPT